MSGVVSLNSSQTQTIPSIDGRYFEFFDQLIARNFLNRWNDSLGEIAQMGIIQGGAEKRENLK